MAIDVSVVVPVFNPGANLESCLHSLLTQTMAPDHYEIVLVDDGSTDGTARELDDWARRWPDRIRVFHEPHSGWPGHPRNVGVEHARGDYVQFVDSDDALAPRALERVLAAARASDADIVLPKSASDFRGVNHDLYRHNADRLTWADFPLVESLTPHKLVRRSFMLDHKLRFADEPRHVEDQLFFVHAYAHAQSVAVVADEVCYLFRRRRGFGRNLGDVVAHPEDYYADLERVLDVIDTHVDDRELAARLYERFYRVEMLGRLRDQPMLDYDDDYRRRLFARVRQVVETRVPREVDDELPLLARAQADRLRAGGVEEMLHFAEQLKALTLTATIGAPRWEPDGLLLDLTALLQWHGQPLTLDALRALAPQADAGHLAQCVADVVLVGRADAATWFVAPGLQVRSTDGGIGVAGTVAIDPRTALAGRPLSPGLWDVRLRVRFGGMTRTARLTSRGAPPATPHARLYDGPLPTVTPYWTAAGGLALDVGEWMHSLTQLVAEDAESQDAPVTWRVRSVVADPPTTRAGDLFLRSGDVTRRAPAELTATLAGASLTTTSRKSSRTAYDEVWVRLGAPGSAAPERLSRSR